MPGVLGGLHLDPQTRIEVVQRLAEFLGPARCITGAVGVEDQDDPVERHGTIFPVLRAGGTSAGTRPTRWSRAADQWVVPQPPTGPEERR
ncbi:hypothetical protein LWF15_01275 [Kineosporia rhizophila]|nr:hypothetical protein [Kineosporia rhizophila]